MTTVSSYINRRRKIGQRIDVMDIEKKLDTHAFQHTNQGLDCRELQSAVAEEQRGTEDRSPEGGQAARASARRKSSGKG
jgi:hypothetical protein